MNLDRLLNLKVIVCAGSGGVGKTTISATIGVWAAKRGKKVLVLTIDPARRLANALGLDANDLSKTGRVSALQAEGELHASMIDSKLVFNSFIENCSPSEEVTQRLFENSLYQQLSTTLSGSQEFTSLEALLQAHESDQYDLVILDTPPSQHAIDFLRAPERIFSLFQKSITQWFVKGPNEVGLFKRLVNQGTKTALSALERVTGSQFIAELSEFFESMSALQEQVGQRSIAVHRLLSSEQTEFVLITALDKAKLMEARNFQKDLRTAGATLAAVIVNRALPYPFVADGMKDLSSDAQRGFDKVRQMKAEEAQYFQQQREFLQKLEGGFIEDGNILCIPEVIDDIVGVEGLQLLENEIVSAAGGQDC